MFLATGAYRGEMIPLALMTLCQGTLVWLKRASSSSGRCLRHTPTWRGRCASMPDGVLAARETIAVRAAGAGPTRPDEMGDMPVRCDSARRNLLHGTVDGVEEGGGFVGARHLELTFNTVWSERNFMVSRSFAESHGRSLGQGRLDRQTVPLLRYGHIYRGVAAEISYYRRII